jgi:hypothetical protein
MTMPIDDQTLEAASAAGQLLIRAAAALATLSEEQPRSLAGASALPALLAASLNSAAQLSSGVRSSLKRHPPAGFQAPV